MLEKYKQSGPRMGRAVVIGYEISNNGRKKAKTEYRTYIKTKLGEVEENVWIQKAIEEIKENDMEELFERVKAHCSSLPWLKKEKDLNEWSLECIYSEAYLHWPDFQIIWM